MTKRLLMIDDDISLSNLVRSYFEPEGYEFDAVRTGREGYLKALEKTPTVILLDLKLPDGDSWNILRKLKSEASLKDTPVLMLSGAQFRPEDKVTGLTLGADDYVGKPVDLDILSAKLSALLRSPTS